MPASSNEIHASPQVGAAQAYVEGLFGGPVDEKETDIALASNTVTSIVQNNPERLALTVINLGGQDAYLALDDSVSTTHGVNITASGGFMNVDVRNDQMLPTRQWFAISPSGATDLYILETKRYALTSPIIVAAPGAGG